MFDNYSERQKILSFAIEFKDYNGVPTSIKLPSKS